MRIILSILRKNNSITVILLTVYINKKKDNTRYYLFLVFITKKPDILTFNNIAVFLLIFIKNKKILQKNKKICRLLEFDVIYLYSNTFIKNI